MRLVNVVDERRVVCVVCVHHSNKSNTVWLKELMRFIIFFVYEMYFGKGGVVAISFFYFIFYCSCKMVLIL